MKKCMLAEERLASEELNQADRCSPPSNAKNNEIKLVTT